MRLSLGQFENTISKLAISEVIIIDDICSEDDKKTLLHIDMRFKEIIVSQRMRTVTLLSNNGSLRFNHINHIDMTSKENFGVQINLNCGINSKHTLVVR